MKNSKRFLGLVAAGMAVAMVAPLSATGATKTTKKRTATTKRAATTTKAPATTAAPATTPATTAAPAATTATTAAPKTGGKITFGLEAETGTGWLPGPGSWAASGHQVSLAVFERLFAYAANGDAVPWLAESAAVSLDGLTWTIKLKTGIKFHNGEAFNAESVKTALDYNVCGSTLTPAWVRLNAGGRLCAGTPAARLTSGITVVDDSTLTIKTLQKIPSLAQLLAGQTGAMAAPAQLKANDRNTLIGTGPFKFKSWKLNEALIVVRNDDYWRKDHMAKVDEISFVPVSDENARYSQLSTGQLDFAHTNNFESIGQYNDLAKAGKIKVLSSEEAGETSHDILNASIPPFNQQSCRLAAAYGLDVETLIKLRAPGAIKANGPFLPGTPGYVGDTGYPSYDLDKAKAQFEKCKQVQEGRTDFTMGTNNTPDDIQLRDIEKQMMERVGFTVRTANIDQANRVAIVLGGGFQWMTWRYYSYLYDIDAYRWNFHSETAAPNGSLSLNWSRIRDGQIDAALDQARDSTDPALRKRVAEAVNRQLGEQAYMLWRWRSRWTVGMCKTCAGVEDPKSPTGVPLVFLGSGLVPDLAALSKG